MSKTKVIVYHRVSSDEQADRGTIASQRHQTQAIVERHGLEVIEVVEDEGLSGVTLDGRRLREVLERIEAGDQIEGIVTVDFDRLMRADKRNRKSREDNVYLEGVLLDFGVSVFTNEGLQDLDSLGYGVKSVVAGAERKKILERTAAGRFRAIAIEQKRIWLAPFGYRKVKDGKTVSMEVDEAQVKVLRQVFGWLIERNAKYAAEKANETHLPTSQAKARPGTKWHPSTVKKFGRNIERYRTGVWEYLWRGQIITHRMPPLDLGPEIFSKVPVVMRERRGSPRHCRYFSGLVRCAHTTEASPHYIFFEPARDNDKHRYSFCGCHECGQVRRLDFVEALIWEAVRVQAMRVVEADRNGADTLTLETELKQVEEEKARTNAEIQRLAKLYLSQAIDEENYAPLAQGLAERKRALDSRQARAKKMVRDARDGVRAREQALDRLVETVQGLWSTPLSVENASVITQATRDLLQGQRIVVDLGRARRFRPEERPVEIRVPGIGSVSELVYREDVRAGWLAVAAKALDLGEVVGRVREGEERYRALETGRETGTDTEAEALALG